MWKELLEIGKVVMLIVLPIGLFFLFVRFTLVSEGTAKVVVRMGGFRKVLLQWERHFLDEEWNVWRKGEEGAPKREKRVFGRILGGLWWYGFWPIDKIYKYPLRWTDLHRTEEAGEKIEKFQFHKEEALDHVMLKPAVYWTKIFRAETKPPERIPVDLEILITMRIFNPYRFLFVAPPTPLEDVLARIDALMRARVSLLTIDELIGLKGKSDVLWEGRGKNLPGLRNERLFEKTLLKWGLKVAERGIDIKSVDLAPEYQEAAAAQKRKELEAKGRAQDIMGTVIAAVVESTGKEREEIQKEFTENPEAFFAKYRTIVESTITKLSMEERSYLRIETPGAGDILGSLLTLIGALKRTPMGRPPSPEKPSPEKPSPEKPSPEKWKEEPEPFGRGRAARIIREMRERDKKG